MGNTGASDRLSIEQVMALIDEHFPQVQEGNGRVSVELLAPLTAHVRMAGDSRSIRPGGTVSGPAMFKLADFSVYALLIAELGPAALPAVTTSMTINFLSKPEPGDMIAHTRLLRLGRRLADCFGVGYASLSLEVVPPELRGFPDEVGLEFAGHPEEGLGPKLTQFLPHLLMGHFHDSLSLSVIRRTIPGNEEDTLSG